jgi:cholesterol transport system auxiliary component
VTGVISGMTGTRHVVLLAAAALAACSFSRPPVERTTYLLTATRDAPAAPAAKPVAVKVRPMRAVPLYERKEFLYRVDGERVVSDFYNEFAEAPESMLTAAATGWLKSAKLFAAVVEPGVPVDAPYALDGSIVALYGDLRDPARPASEVAVQFYLVRLRGSGPELVYDRVLRSRVDASSRDPRALAAGYNKALAQILGELERDLAGLELK